MVKRKYKVPIAPGTYVFPKSIIQTNCTHTICRLLLPQDEYSAVGQRGIDGREKRKTTISTLQFVHDYPELIQKNREGQSWIDEEFGVMKL